MSSTLLTLYVLFWPTIAAGVLATLLVSLFFDIRKAKKTGKSLV